MALSPIQIFQQQQSPLTALLQSGTTEISRVMDRAVQIGRDIANKQLAQEQDLLAMRRNETNLAQRRAENLQQDWEDTMRFVRGAYEFDQKFGADQLYRQQQVGMDQARMAQQASQFDAEMGLRQATGAREERRLGLAEREFQAEQDARQQERASIDTMFTPSKSQTSSFEMQGPRVPMTDQQRLDLPTDERMRAQRLESPYLSVDAAPVAADPRQIYREYGNMEQVMASREATPQQKAAARSRLLELEAQMPKEGKDEKGLTPYQQAAEARRTAKDLEESQRKEADVLVKDVGAFVPPSVWLSQKYGLTTAKTKAEQDELESKIPPELLAERERYKADPLGMEMSYALSYKNPDEYVLAPEKNLTEAQKATLNLTDAQKAKRLRFWQIAHGQASSGTAPASTGTSLASDYVKSRSSQMD